MRVSPRLEAAVVLVPSAAELLTVCRGASPLELFWHTASVAVLLLRHRLPVAVLAATLPVAFTGYLLIAPMAALYQVAKDIRTLRTVGCCAVLVFLAGLLPWWPLRDGEWTYEEVLFGVLSAAMMSAGPTAVGRLVRARSQLCEQIAELARARDRERVLLAEMAAAEERARLAREMHDVVAHQISLIAVQAGALEATSRDQDSRGAAATIRALSSATLEELRHLVGALRSARKTPGLADLPALVESTGLPVRFSTTAVSLTSWPEAVQHTAYRTVQEALTNVRKHAPHADVAVSLTAAAAEPEDGPALAVEIRNNRSEATGPAERLPAGGHGLPGLRERAELLGGRLESGPTDDGGFRVCAVLPGTRATTAPRASQLHEAAR
ncbi:sensor histidine kinase [Streptomyces cyaneofuscatus]|uniref:sensor histidine kinase n=1 Tax=Streptomyces cyaneofuscatus TaxID=66883 RepID=UPI00342A6FAB